MEINIIEQSKNFLRIEIVGEDHTLSNAIRKELWENPNVKAAGYKIEHSLVNDPVMLIETSGSETPKKALINAIENIKKRNKELLADFNKSLK